MLLQEGAETEPGIEHTLTHGMALKHTFNKKLVVVLCVSPKVTQVRFFFFHPLRPVEWTFSN